MAEPVPKILAEDVQVTFNGRPLTLAQAMTLRRIIESLTANPTGPVFLLGISATERQKVQAMYAKLFHRDYP